MMSSNVVTNLRRLQLISFIARRMTTRAAAAKPTRERGNGRKVYVTRPGPWRDKEVVDVDEDSHPFVIRRRLQKKERTRQRKWAIWNIFPQDVAFHLGRHNLCRNEELSAGHCRLIEVAGGCWWRPRMARKSDSRSFGWLNSKGKKLFNVVHDRDKSEDCWFYALQIMCHNTCRRCGGQV